MTTFAGGAGVFCASDEQPSSRATSATPVAVGRQYPGDETSVAAAGHGRAGSVRCPIGSDRYPVAPVRLSTEVVQGSTQTGCPRSRSTASRWSASGPGRVRAVNRRPGDGDRALDELADAGRSCWPADPAEDGAVAAVPG